MRFRNFLSLRGQRIVPEEENNKSCDSANVHEIV